jgi:hypothetical protein
MIPMMTTAANEAWRKIPRRKSPIAGSFVIALRRKDGTQNAEALLI